jgi:uncharacterized membrane protein
LTEGQTGMRVLLAEVVDGVWRPGIGDPTVIGWATVVAYLIAAAGCLRAAWREPRPDGSRWPSGFWLALAAMMLALGVNKQLDLQSLVTVVGRRVLRAQGLYGRRRTYQVAFILAVAATCAGLLAVLLRACRYSVRGRRLATAGMVFVLGFVIIRASSFHHVDALIAARLGGMKWNWIFELGGIAAVSLGAYRVAPVTAGRDVPIGQ